MNVVWDLNLISKTIRIENRRTFKAYDGINNTFNLAYAILKYRVHKAILKAHLEPFLGFVHSEAFGKPSLVCDMMELYRFSMDDFLIQYCQKLGKADFKTRFEDYSPNRKAKREYLNRSLTTDLTRKLSGYFERKVEIPRIRHGSR